MTVDEAIEILEDTLYNRYRHHPDDIEKATKLAIEAMLRLRTLRVNPRLSPSAPLPSESEE